MSIEQLKTRLRDIPGIESLTMTLIGGRQTFGFDGLIAAVDPNSSDDEIEHAIRSTAQLASLGRSSTEKQIAATPLPTVNLTEPKPMTTPTKGTFAASLKAMLDDARDGLDRARVNGRARVQQAVDKYADASAATERISETVAQQIEESADAAMSELGQISNDIGV